MRAILLAILAGTVTVLVIGGLHNDAFTGQTPAVDGPVHNLYISRAQPTPIRNPVDATPTQDVVALDVAAGPVLCEEVSPFTGNDRRVPKHRLRCSLDTASDGPAYTLQEPQFYEYIIEGSVEYGISVEIRDIICNEQWPWTCAWAISTVLCESGWRPLADENPPYVGLWQIDRELHLWRFSGPLFDPYANTEVAAQLFRERGKQPWPYCGYLGGY